MNTALLQRLAALLLLLSALTLATACDTPVEEPLEFDDPSGDLTWEAGGKADDLFARSYEVLLTDPYCDECTFDDRAVLTEISPIIEGVVDLIDSAERTVDAAQFTFSVSAIEQALYRARDRGVAVRVAMDAGQDRDGSLSRRLLDNGIDLRFTRGMEVPSQDRYGLMHSKFMVVDHHTVLSGSNNWSSTGVTINEENTIIVRATEQDPLVQAFTCHFEAAWENAPQTSSACSTADARFSPGVGGRNLIRDGIRSARTSVDVLMHHFLFGDLVRELHNAADRGVEIRLIVNATDRESYTGGQWDDLVDAGARIRFKQVNPDAFQYMHHKLAIIDGHTLLHGSGNWSGSGFFNNYEFYVRYDHPHVLGPFNDLYTRLWAWSLSPESLDAGLNAARQHHGEHQVFFGNLHAHYQEADADGLLWDDGELLRALEPGGDLHDVSDELGGRPVARYAFEYARDRGGMDFMALTPHVSDFRVTDPPDMPNLGEEGYAQILSIARDVTSESDGGFVAMGGMEWNTLSNGNHVNIFGTRTLSKVDRGRFDVLYDEFLPARVESFERPIVQLNHPRSFRQSDTLSGNWDQIFDVYLTEITSDAQRGRKFTDFGINYYSPLSEVRQSWLDGDAMPSRFQVGQTMQNMAAATADYIRLMEVTIGRGTDIAHEHGENPSWVTRDGEPYHYTRVESDWHYYLLNGFRLAPTANHDNHYANWGAGHSTRTAIIAPALTERDLMDSMHRRMVYASEDQNLAIGFYADGRIPMGSEMATTRQQVNFQLYFEDPDYDGLFEARVMLGRVGDDAVQTRTHMQRIDPARWHGLTVPLPEPGEYFVYVEIHKPDTQRTAWTAPIFITRH